MSYYSGSTDIPVKPVTRRVTFTRGKHRQVSRRYLQKTGRRPLNRHAYPVMGTPVAADLAMQPGHFGGEPDDAFSMRGLNVLSPSSRGPVLIAAQTRSGRRILTRPYDPFSSVSLGASILDPLSIVSNYVPGIPSVVAAPTPQSSSVWDLPSAIANLWNSRPDVLKKIKVRVNPVKVAQQVLSPSQVQAAVDYARQMGIDPSYHGVPITGYSANAGYRIAGMDLGQYFPWIIGGAALLFIVPMVMKK